MQKNENSLVLDAKQEKKKRAKPFNAKGKSKKHLEDMGWTVADVEMTIPHTFIKRDCMGFADLLCCSPTRGIMLVQATGGEMTSNLHEHIRKVKAEPRHAIWLATGGRIQIHMWQGKGKERDLRVFELTREVASE